MAPTTSSELFERLSLRKKIETLGQLLGSCWAQFSSPTFTSIEVPGNTNDKMSQQVCIDKILEPIVKDFVIGGRRRFGGTDRGKVNIHRMEGAK